MRWAELPRLDLGKREVRATYPYAIEPVESAIDKWKGDSPQTSGWDNSDRSGGFFNGLVGPSEIGRAHV